MWNFSKNNKTSEVGYDLNPIFQGKGIMNEALKSVVDFGFSKLNLNKIEEFTHKENESSKRLLKKIDSSLLKTEKMKTILIT